ncbi:MAG: hypothetical protein ABIK79_11050 [Chloroflexota bacterium]|nr:hypothetical protein [Anaerolineae bacterium]
MAKRKKRSKARKQQQTQLAKSRKTTISTAEKKKADKVSFKEEYYYVLGDLKRMGVLAAVMFALMIVLAFIL